MNDYVISVIKETMCNILHWKKITVKNHMFIIFLDIHSLFLQIMYPTIKVRLNNTQYGSLPDWYGLHLAHYGLISKRQGSFLERHGSLLARYDFFKEIVTCFLNDLRCTNYVGVAWTLLFFSDISLWFCPIDISKSIFPSLMSCIIQI